MYNFKKDIEEGLKKYPSLKSISDRQIRGVFTASQKEANVHIEDYEILIEFPHNYPYTFPTVKELSNKIPKTVYRHIFLETGNLCFGNFIDEMRVCVNGISFIYFLENVLNPHLCREYVKEATGCYPTGERSHSPEGQWESYYELLETQNKEDILNEIDFALKSPSIKRNDICRCGSNKKYKNCHLKIENTILEIGIKNLQFIFNYLKNDFLNRT